MSAPFRVIKSLERQLEKARSNLAEAEAEVAHRAHIVSDTRLYIAELEASIDALHALDEEES